MENYKIILPKLILVILSKHLKQCLKLTLYDLKQTLLARYGGVVVTLLPKSDTFEVSKFRDLLSIVIIMPDLPFQFIVYCLEI